MATQRHRLGAALLSTALAFTVGCADDAPLTAPDTADTVIGEAAVDVAAGMADTQQDAHFGRADRQRDRRRDHTHDGLRIDRAELVVTFGASAVELATAILDRDGADDRQQALLAEAVRLQEAAEAALESEETALAVRLARQACWTALKAWVLPDGVTAEEAEAVRALAEDLLRSAADAVGDDDGVRGLILEWATAFYVNGAEALEGGQVRGVAALWKAAVLSYTLVS